MNIVGIDLGTTFSSLAVLGKEGEPDIVPDADGERITPSVVFFDPDEDAGSDVLVGVEALKQVRRDDRQGYISHKVKRKMDKDPYGDIRFPDLENAVEFISRTPVEISSLILEKLIKDAEKTKGTIDEAVISVPAGFGTEARKATKEAGKLAGLAEIQLVDEPVAAACFYAWEKSVKGRVLVYDLGGGTFDVAVVEIGGISGKEVTIRSSQGCNLGGKDFDKALCSIADQKHFSEFDDWLYVGEDPSLKLMFEAEDHKKTLSTRKHVEWVIEGKGEIKITREEFEESISDLLSDANKWIDVVLEEKGLDAWDIDSVLLVGGSTRIPYIRHLLEDRFGSDKVCEAVNPDEAVARGAAIYSGWRNPDKLNAFQKATLSPFKVKNILGHYLGTVALERPEKYVASRFREIVAPGSTARKIAEELKQDFPCGLREPGTELQRVAGPDSAARAIAEEVKQEFPGRNTGITFTKRKNRWVQRAKQIHEIVEFTEYIGGPERMYGTPLYLIRDLVLRTRTLRDAKVSARRIAGDRILKYFTECEELWIQRAEHIPEIIEFAEHIAGPSPPCDALKLIGDVVFGIWSLQEAVFEAKVMVKNWFNVALREGRIVGEPFNSIILRGSRQIPCSETRRYSTAYHGQTSLPIEVTRSTVDVKDLKSSRVKIIARGILEDLPEDRIPGLPVRVTFEYGLDKILKCSYTDVSTGASRSFELVPDVASPDEI